MAKDGPVEVDASNVTELGRGRGSPPVLGLEELYRSQRSSVLRLATALTGDRVVAEDIVQDAFLELSRRWDLLENPVGYLRTAVCNRSRSHHRRLGMIRRRSPPPVPLKVEAPELDELWAVLARLSPRRRVALVLRFYEDLSVEEIARLMKCRPGTVSSLLHRGLADLRKGMTSETRP
jgi:RNA polymerase sigma factor (sigma-70 family)